MRDRREKAPPFTLLFPLPSDPRPTFDACYVGQGRIYFFFFFFFLVNDHSNPEQLLLDSLQEHFI